MADANVVEFKPSTESAIAEIRRQLDQAYALIYGARMILKAEGSIEVEPADRLLDMAEDVLSAQEYINRIDPPRSEAQEVDNG